VPGSTRRLVLFFFLSLALIGMHCEL